jgi:2-C-methyl-D-erythritol 2,4-cyclodiphosphate synthase
MTLRIGHGYDIHRLKPGRKLILGGVEIPFELGLEGHSDADVAVHAVIDSLLGAASLGDMGTHFPDDDPAYKDADSIRLLDVVSGMIADSGFTVGNIDVTVIAEKPRLGPFVEKMRDNIAKVAGVTLDSVSVKATTSEQLDSIGRGEAIASHAVCLLLR